jgi:cobalt-zinc-cadmium efflux system outer membrane protein
VPDLRPTLVPEFRAGIPLLIGLLLVGQAQAVASQIPQVPAPPPNPGAGVPISAPVSSLTWNQVKDALLAKNPTILAGQLTVAESRTLETSALLRPNPQVSLSGDGTQLTPHDGIWRPLSGVVLTPGASYLIERGNKRELRGDSARLATSGVTSDQQDVTRNLVFVARSAFLATLQAKALLQVTKDNLEYYDRVIALNRGRFTAGDISELDFDRIQIQRVQFESDYENARVSLRTAKIQLLAVLNDRRPVDSFDVEGDFDFRELSRTGPDLHQQAADSRPDLRSAAIAIEKARADHQLAIANGTADPTISAWYSHNPSFANPYAVNTFGTSVSVPLRIFDRNQGEKARTLLEIQRAGHVRESLLSDVYRDVDSAYAAVESVQALLRPYRDRYLQQSASIRDKVSFSYSQGNATLLEFLDAQKSYRDTQVAYLNLIGAYWNAFAQLSLAVGQEVNP